MIETRNPRTVAELVRRRLSEADFAGFTDLFAADALFEYPFAAPGWPSLLRGREEIRAHLAESRTGLLTLIELTGFTSVVHETTDPEVVVLEFEASGITLATGKPFRFASGVGVMTVRDGEIVRYRDYTNAIGAAAITGSLPDLAARIAP